MKKTLLLFTTLLLCLMGFSQSENYNLPPGAKLKTKANVEEDYSYKLNNLSNPPKDFSEPDFFIEFNKEDLEEKMSIDNEYKSYIDEATSFYKDLSMVVKYNFTPSELWYIYQFDQKLKNRLEEIK